jgi:hypothetical protein
LAIHYDVAEAVDALLRGYPLPTEIRTRTTDGEIKIEKGIPESSLQQSSNAKGGFRRMSNGGPRRQRQQQWESSSGEAQVISSSEDGPLQTMRIYAYGVARNRLIQAAKRLGVPVLVVKDLGEADVLVTLRNYYRKRQRPIVDAENKGMPIYVLRSNTVNQMQKFLSDLYNISSESNEEQTVERALQETQGAINAVLNGERWIELPPAISYVRRLQHEMARQANLTSHSYGKEPNRRVRIFRE